MTERWGLQFNYDLGGVGVTNDEAYTLIDHIRSSELALGDYTYATAGQDALNLTVSFQVTGSEIGSVLRDAAVTTLEAVQLSGIPVIALTHVVTTHLNEGSTPDDPITFSGLALDRILHSDA